MRGRAAGLDSAGMTASTISTTSATVTLPSGAVVVIRGIRPGETVQIDSGAENTTASSPTSDSDSGSDTGAAETATPRLSAEDVKWVVNELGELGVKIGRQFFWLYKGMSILQETVDPSDPNGVKQYRRVGKREFGEVCRPPTWPNNPGGHEWHHLPYRPEDKPKHGQAMYLPEDPGAFVRAEN